MGTVLGSPKGSSDPRKINCAERTVRNKIGKMTYLHIYFDSYGVTKFTKSQRFGWQELVGVFGGVVGLCMGFSLLSGAEFIYFFTLRLFIDFCRQQQKKA